MEKKKNHKTRQKYQNSNTFKTHGGEKNDGKSQTVQDESYTIRELLEKHTQGLMPNVGLNPQYDHDEPTHDDDVTLRSPDFDLSDIDKMKEKVSTAKNKLQKAQKEKQKAGTATPDRSSTANDGTEET